MPKINRRKFFGSAAAIATTGAWLKSPVGAAASQASDLFPLAEGQAGDPVQSQRADQHLPPGNPGIDYTPVVTPNNLTLGFRVVDGVKVFHLIAEEVDHEFAPGLKAKCWGYNGCVPGPTIEAVEGERVRIYVTNRLPEGTTVHWHGLVVPNGMDGVGGLTQKVIDPGETYKYEFNLHQHGAYMYHSHADDMIQEGMGLVGMFIVHPRQPAYRPDRDFVILLNEWKIVPGTSRPDPTEMTDFNVLTMNGRCFPGTEALVARKGERVRIRFGNLSAMDHHPIHLHGHAWVVTATDGGPIPSSARYPETTILVAVGQTRTVEFLANNPGDWAMHCHMTHHTMNQMGHGLPNLIGVDPGKLDRRVSAVLKGYMTMGQDGMGDMGEMSMGAPRNSIPMAGGEAGHGYVTMGGMFTVLKVRESLESYADPGWYRNPPGTLAELVTPDEMKRDLQSGL